MNKKLNQVLDNRWIQRLIFPIAIYHIIQSYVRIRQENKLLQQTINDNDEFFKAIGQLGFKPDGYLGELISIQKFEPGLKLEDINGIAQKTILGVVKKFVQDENLLGIIMVDCRLDKQHVVTTIRPTTIPVLLGDLYDAIISFFIIVAIILFCYKLFY